MLNSEQQQQRNRHTKPRSQLFNLNVMVYLLLWYGSSSLTTQLTKSILNEFEFPVFVGEFQFLFNFLLGYITIYLSSKPLFCGLKNWFPYSTFPQNDLFLFDRHLFKLFLPMGTFQFIGKLFSLAATSICPVATVSSIRALSPLFIVIGYRLHYKLLFSLQTYLSLLPLLLGVIIIVISQSAYSNISNNDISIYNEQLNTSEKINNFNSIADDSLATNQYNFLSNFLSLIQDNKVQLHGILYALLSTSIFAAGSIYAKNVITNNNINKSKEIVKLALSSSITPLNNDIDIEKNKITKNQQENYLDRKKPVKIDKLTTLMYCSLYGLAYSIPGFLTYELPILLSSKLYPSSLDNIPAASTTPIFYYNLIPWKLLILNGFSYFSQTLLAFHILGMLPTVTYSIAAMMKRITVIGISMLIRGKRLGILEWLGLLHITAGLYVYEKWGAKQKS